MIYESLEQRMAQTYIDTFPRFIPNKRAIVGISMQEQFYNLMKNLYHLAFNEPLLFVPKLHEDDAHPNRFNKSSYGKPDLQVNMRKFMKAMDTLLQNMFIIGREPDTKINKRQQIILMRLGIDDFNHLPAAWVWMSTRSGASPAAFSHCFFRDDYPYTSEIYSRLFGDEAAFRKLENWMIEQGYIRFDILDAPAGDCKLSMTYANPAWSQEPPRGGFQYKIKHTGISAQYDPLAQYPPILGLCIPNGMKTYLDAFELMDEQVQGFVMAHNKKCDGCRYCVQTDKTGTRPLACITVSYEQKKYSLCPYFPGYSYCWTSISDDLTAQLIAMLSFMDNWAPKAVGCN